MRNDAAHKEGWQIFEVVFGIPFLVGVIMQWVVPFSLLRGSATLIFVSIGIALIILGTILVAVARRELRRYGQPTNPGHPTHKIVTTGVFSISRNPLYLGGVGILLGLALALNLPWAIVFLLPALIACHYILIAPEERYLAGKFGEEYRLYSEKVGRWVGRKR
ncbi:MAG TPA: isoprenylcysteine carboxylmethyltransferase family protein [Anaerolineales bacterium]|nr:isoprenylcysteine carboxylmethyltransferase family protein [Anaerolineales bacterium]HLO29689.1 isoprenylcysteine carboxylmethyltransferase family protein [Anaerolineales bacterium]